MSNWFPSKCPFCKAPSGQHLAGCHNEDRGFVISRSGRGLLIKARTRPYKPRPKTKVPEKWDPNNLWK